MARESADTPGRIARGFELCLGRSPSAGELAALADLHAAAFADLAASSGRAEKLAGDAKWPDGMAPAEKAALFNVANILLNTDAFLTLN